LIVVKTSKQNLGDAFSENVFVEFLWPFFFYGRYFRTF
jgi:hypothetical protein